MPKVPNLISGRVDDDLNRRLQRVADATGETRSAILRRVIEAGVAEVERLVAAEAPAMVAEVERELAQLAEHEDGGASEASKVVAQYERMASGLRPLALR